MFGGWYLAAFESELDGDLTPVTIGDTPLILVNDGERIRVFDAICPHRGANLGYGGSCENGAVKCPFHGKRIALGRRADTPYWIREYSILGYGGMFFVRLSDEHENGLGAMLDHIAVDHTFAPCFAVPVRAPGDLVIENAFDDAHFPVVHGMLNEPRLAVRSDTNGALVAEGTFEVPVSLWQRGDGRAQTVHVPFAAHAFSPYLVVSHLGGDNPYWVITAATPLDESSCVVRLAVAVPSGRRPDQPHVSKERLEFLARQSRGGIEQDRLVWENLRPLAKPAYGPEDRTMLRFRKFCERFVEAQAT